MPTLTLRFKDNLLGTYHLRKGSSLTIGRSDDNEVIIENLAVSGHHAKIDSVGDGFLLTDLKSKNGSYVNKELISSHWLKAGDVIIIGKHTLHFSEVEQDQPTAPKSAGAKPAPEVKAERRKSPRARFTSDSASPESAGAEPLGILSFLAGGKGEIELHKKLVKIGRDAASDIIVSGLTVAQTAATISRRPRGYFLSYVGGMAKPKVNGETIRDSVLLKDFDIITLGSAKLQFVSR